MAETGRDGAASVRIMRAREAMARLPWVDLLQAAAGIAVVAVGLAAAGGIGWAAVSARQAMHGRMATYVRSAPHPSMVLMNATEVADNTR